MKYLPLFIFAFFFKWVTGSCQMYDPDLQDTLYGNEWIDFNNPGRYLKLSVAEDGIYRIWQADLPTSFQGVEGSKFQLFHLGKEIPLLVSNDGVLQAGDYIDFFGKKNQAEIDKFLFKDPETEILNPYYSLFSDTSAYFLTWTDTGAGKRFRSQANNTNNPPAPLPFFYRDIVYIKPEVWSGASWDIAGEDIFDSQFNYEGFGSTYAKSITAVLQAINPFPGGPDAQVSLGFASSQTVTHIQEISLNGSLVNRDSFTGQKFIQKNFSWPNANLGSSLTIKIEGTNANNDRSSLFFVQMRYPASFDFQNQSFFHFNLDASPADQYLEIANFNTSGQAPILIDLSNQFWMRTEVANGKVLARLPASAEPRQIALYHPAAGIQSAAKTESITFEDLRDVDANYIQIAHPKFLSATPNYVAQYANYRSSSQGGGFKPVIVDIQQLYDQFAYGIQRHPISIRNFGNYAHKFWNTSIEYVLLFGKPREFTEIRDAASLAQADEKTFFIPTWGTPSSDNLLLCNNYSNVPLVPIGRIAATESEQIGNYLEKVIQYEAAQSGFQSTIESQLWSKKIAHLSGGLNASEQSVIRYYMEVMEQYIESGAYAGEVSTFYKTTDDVVIKSQTVGLKELIDNGLGMLVFFGHSNPNILDFNFDDPGSYDNTGKYPVFIANGCFSGNCATSNAGIGERFIAAKEKGAIAFFATSGYGFTSELFILGKSFYELLSSDYYGKSIGKIFRATLDSLDNVNPLRFTLLQQSVMQGDPAISIYHHPGPDYVLDNASVQTIPQLINIQLDSFQLALDLYNIGKGTADTTISIQIEQQLPDGTVTFLKKDTVEAPSFRTSLLLTLPFKGGENAIGLNRILIKIDPDNQIRELPAAAESNNQYVDNFGNAGLPVFIVSNDLLPLDPLNYSIKEDGDVELSASTVSFFLEDQDFIFEIDTSYFFNVATKNRAVVRAKGGLVTWKPGMSLQPGQVYYWRVTPDSTGLSGGYRWQRSSFVYLPDSLEGWNQSDWGQWSENSFSNLEVKNRQDRPFSFVRNLRDIKIRNYIYNNPSGIPGILLDNNRIVSYQGGTTNAIPGGIMVCVFDTVFAQPFTNTGAYGSDRNVGRGFIFKVNDSDQRAEVIEFLDQVVPSGSYVALMTVQRDLAASYFPEQWASDTLIAGNSILKSLERQGAVRIKELPEIGSRPYNLFYKKDDPGWPVQESIGDLSADVLEQNTVIRGFWDNGTMTSRKIGPSKSWKSLHWDTYGADTTADYTAIDVIGLRNDQTDSLILSGFTQRDTSLAFMDASEFPFLLLRYTSVDSALRTPVQLAYWRVHFEGIPEAALAPNEYFVFQKDTLNVGEQLIFDIGIKNVSRQPMDSLLVRYTLTNAANQSTLFDDRLRELPAGDTVHARYTLLTTDFAPGNYRLFLDFNPGMEQPERTHINNFGGVPFYIRGDQVNPVLDVTFDGDHITNGQLISPTPEIVVLLRDENQYTPLTDTSLIELSLRYPDNPNFFKVPLQDPSLQFIPADPSSLPERNQAKMVYQPEFTQDGVYTLRVRARDMAGNLSGKLDYEISFEVITKSMISNLVNYPNPFSTSTRFVYTLTGSEAPTFFKIQIMTISGRIVREITQAEIGPLRPGTHLTEYVWNGTDEFGDPLANGVYLYRVIAQKANGEPFELYKSGADAFTSKGFGKLVILR